MITWELEGADWHLSVERRPDGWLWLVRQGRKYSTGYCATEELAIEAAEHVLGLAGPCSGTCRI